MLLKDLPADARPREKLLARGPQALADAELVALLLRTGVKGDSVLGLAQRLLDDFGGLTGLLRADPQALQRIKGLGPAKLAQVSAVLELARRSLGQQMAERPVLDNVILVKDYLRLQLGGRGHEVFSVLFLDAQHRLIQMDEMFRGSLTQASVYPREVLKRALQLHAAAVILAHNHPSGSAQPSRSDEVLTQTLKSALAMIDVRVLDHLVVGDTEVVSFVERGLL
jgi:DNA repair protein RadC